MASTHSIGINYDVDGLRVVSASAPTNISDNTTLVESIVVPISTTNKHVALAFLVANLKAFVLSSDHDVTLTNLTSSATVTILIKAGDPIVWKSTGPFTNPFTVDIANIYLTNASGVNACNVELRFLVTSV